MKYKHTHRRIKSVLCVALSCSLLVGSGCNKEEFMYNSAKVPKIASAVYPEMAAYPEEDDYFDESFELWRQQGQDRLEAGKELEKYQEGLWDFYGKTINTFLADGGDKNRVYSPVNLYFALAVSAEITDGESRRQLLELLGADSIESLRQQTECLWAASYRNDVAATTILANSLWLNEGINYKKETVNTLAEKYYVSSFQGDPSSEDMTNALRAWLNEQTGGLLKDAVENVKLDPRTVAAVCSTVYFSAKWSSVFSKDKNDYKTFHSVKGDMEREFMNKNLPYGPYYYGEDFGAVYISFAEGGAMWFILPDEGKSVNDVFSSGEYLEMLAAPNYWDNKTSIKVNCSVPKFDVASEIDLSDGLKKLSVTDIFDIEKSDFSPLTEDTEVYFTEAKHAARVTIDEEGCTAAAFTAMLAAGAAIPPADEIDFVVDRPFVFAVTGDSGQLLFAGEVYDV